MIDLCTLNQTITAQQETQQTILLFVILHLKCYNPSQLGLVGSNSVFFFYLTPREPTWKSMDFVWTDTLQVTQSRPHFLKSATRLLREREISLQVGSLAPVL